MLSAGSLFSQSWQEMYDSTMSLIWKGNFPKAVDIGEEALKLAEKEFGKMDTNYIQTLEMITWACIVSRQKHLYHFGIKING